MCEFCSKKFVHQTSLRNHLNVHRGVKNFCCSHCGWKFTTGGNLKSHLLLHEKNTNDEDDKKFPCKICNKTFRRLSALREHETSHTKLKAYQCKTCLKNFSSSSNLAKHKTLHDSTKANKFSCIEVDCDRKFNQKIHLQKHMMRAHGIDNRKNVSGTKTNLNQQESCSETNSGNEKSKIIILSDELIKPSNM